MDFTFEDGKRLRSVMWNKEELDSRKRRLLMRSATVTTHEGIKKKSKKSMFPTDLYLLESDVRNDEVSNETVRTTIERTFSNGGKDYVQLIQRNQENNCNHGLLLKQFVHDKTPIYNMLDELNEMSYPELTAINKKLRGVSLVPKFPPHRFSGNKDLLIKRLEKKFTKCLSMLGNGDELPMKLSKALSVIYLSSKHRSMTYIDVQTSEFYPFSTEMSCLHNRILEALLLIPKFRNHQLKDLHALLDLKAEVPIRCFRSALRSSLIEYLFECNETSAPQYVLKTLDFINNRIKCQAPMFSKMSIHEEVEAVMTLSCQLKRIISNPLDQTDDDELFLKELGNDENTNAFNLVDTYYFSGHRDNEHELSYESCSNYEDKVPENTGQCIPTAFTASSNSFLPSEAANEMNSSSSEKPKMGHDDDIDVEKHCEDSAKLSLESTSQNTRNMTVKSVQEVCDETALVANKLIGSMLDKLLITEGIYADYSTRSYLNGGSSNPLGFQGTEDMFKTSKENIRSQIFVQTVEELVPSLTNSCIRRVKNLMES